MTGEVRIRALVGAAQTTELQVFGVSFEPGARNLLHTHSFDQVLCITAGEGIVASGGEEVVVRAGDIVVVPAGEEHWHGATAATAMTHLAFGVPGTTEVEGRPYVPPA